MTYPNAFFCHKTTPPVIHITEDIRSANYVEGNLLTSMNALIIVLPARNRKSKPNIIKTPAINLTGIAIAISSFILYRSKLLINRIISNIQNPIREIYNIN